RTNAGGDWQLQDGDNDNVWKTTVQLNDLDHDRPQFKFVVNGSRWLPPPAGAANAVSDGKGSINLEIQPNLSATPVLEIHPRSELDLATPYRLILEGVAERPVFAEITPGALLDDVVSTADLGCTFDVATQTTTYRLFAHRASSVQLCLYDGPTHRDAQDRPLEPRWTIPMVAGQDGVWSASVPGVDRRTYYAYRVDGPAGAGEGFNADAPVADPYARALAHAENNAIAIDPLETNQWFAGWTDSNFQAPPLDEAIIYEAHVRDFSIDPSSGVDLKLRGKYAGIVATEGTGTGLDHLKQMGINYIELLPVSEFGNGDDRYDWGYGPTHYFAPEASYAQRPLEGSQYYEFKTLVDALHARGFGVIIDVVYNHVGSPNAFSLLDRKYYFRQDQDFKFSNYSGCGNDIRTEAPMMRRLIVDNVLYWMREHHIDGFRFDLAELIDMGTLMAIRDEARELNPDVLLISEPWSFRGDHRSKIAGTGWAAWNGEFRHLMHGFIRGEGLRENVRELVRGSVDRWAKTPAEVVNYLESHDDKSLADELTTHPSGDGRNLSERDAARNRLGATLLFTSLGTPMIAEGQEWIRSKHGIHNTYNKGDRVNALRWQDRERPLANETMNYYRDLITLRRSPGGATFRWLDAVPDDYHEWVMPQNLKAIGYIVNGDRKYPGAAFVVLANAADQPVRFPVKLPSGRWRIIGDGRHIDPNGISGIELPRPQKGIWYFEVPGVTAYILAGL
ncbi:MAG: alpha-amylase family glycosyl hydrolase, partial [Verrucomicrobia bacterium]|nr:alpha-amylase family glycosyl hydrolase [Verrucomicrobiota bacterium]